VVKQKLGVAAVLEATDKTEKIAVKKPSKSPVIKSSDTIAGESVSENLPLVETPAAAKLIMVPASDLWPSPMNPRKHFNQEALAELSQSIKEQGILQPVVVRKKPGQVAPDPKLRQLYEVICGARRIMAAEMIGAEFMVQAIVRELTDEAAFDLMITENLQRQDINVMEEARAFKALQDRGMSQQLIADRFGKSHVFIWQCIELNKCIEPIQQLIETGEMSKRVGLAISKYQADDQLYWFEKETENISQYTEADVKDALKLSVSRRFYKAKFILNDTTFSPDQDIRIQAASCLGCAFNAGNIYSVNYDADNTTTCLARRCFDAKNELFTARVLQLLPAASIVLFGRGEHSDQYTFENLQDKTIMLNGQYDVHYNYSLQEVGVPEQPDEPDEPDVDWHDGPEDPDYLEEVAEYKKDMEAYLAGKNSFAMAFWEWLENGAKTSMLERGQLLGYYIDSGEFKIICLKNGAAVSVDAESRNVVPPINPVEIQNKIDRNLQLVEEKLYDALAGELSGLATYAGLNNLDPQPALTDAEWLVLYANMLGYQERRDMTDQVRKALNLVDGGHVSDKLLLRVMHNIGPWIIRRHIMSSYHPAQGANAYKNLSRWNDVALSQPDISVDEIRSKLAATYEKRNEKLRAQLSQTEGVK